MTLLDTRSAPKRAVVITPADSDLVNPVRRLYVGGTGNITLTTVAGDAVLISAIPVGTTLDVECKRVSNTGTTATLIVGFYD